MSQEHSLGAIEIILPIIVDKFAYGQLYWWHLTIIISDLKLYWTLNNNLVDYFWSFEISLSLTM